MDTKCIIPTEEDILARQKKNDGPLSLTVLLPPPKKHFTIGEIIKIAEKKFDFSIINDGSKTEGATGGDGNKRNEYSGKRSTTEKHVRHILDEIKKETERDSSDSSQNPSNAKKRKKYSRQTVTLFFRDYENQLYFLEIAEFQINKELAIIKDKKEASDDDKGNREQLLQRRKEVYEKRAEINTGKERRAEYRNIIIKSFDAHVDDDETDIFVREHKERILTQFLFESFIDLDEELLTYDVGINLECQDELLPTPEEIQASLRLKNLHDYYKAKINLADMNGAILQRLETLDKRLETIGERLETQGERLETLDKRLTVLGKRLKILDGRTKEILEMLSPKEK